MHRIFALIAEGLVKNVIVCDDYELANYVARASYGDTALAVDITDIPVMIGDKYYTEGYFTRMNEKGEEVRIDPIPSPQTKIESLVAQIAYLLLKQGAV